MKKGNVTILASIFIMALVAAGVSAGTQAWFSDTKTASVGEFTVGTLSIWQPEVSISSDIANWAPGEKHTVTIKIANTGTLDVWYLGGNLVLDGWQSVALASVIKVTGFHEFIPGYKWIDNLGPDQLYQTLVGNYDGTLTLLELAQSYHGAEPGAGAKTDQFGGKVNYLADWITGSGYDQTPGPAIRVRQAGEFYWLVLELELMGPETTNGYQGYKLDFHIDFTACQGQDSYLTCIP